MSAYVYGTFQSVSQMKQKQGQSSEKDADHEEFMQCTGTILTLQTIPTENEVVEGQVE